MEDTEFTLAELFVVYAALTKLLDTDKLSREENRAHFVESGKMTELVKSMLPDLSSVNMDECVSSALHKTAALVREMTS